MDPINPEERLVVTLTAQQWNIVLGALGEAPFRIAQPVVQQIIAQAQRAQQMQEQTVQNRAVPPAAFINGDGAHA